MFFDTIIVSISHCKYEFILNLQKNYGLLYSINAIYAS